MGLVERAELFREVLASFGPKGPSTNREKRQAQLSEAAKRDDELYKDAETRYYACQETIDACAARFVVRNAESFK